MSRKKGKQSAGGITPKQQGHIVEAAQPADPNAGSKGQIKTSGYPAMANIKAGSPPNDIASTPTTGEKVRSGAAAFQGKIIKGTPSVASSGAAPGNMHNGGTASKTPSDIAQLKMDDNCGSYAKGGKVGGKVNRHGADSGKAPGNGALPGGNAAIPLAQPGGAPSTGIVDSGSMNPSFAGVTTPQPAAALRGPTVKRVGRAPSLPRPRRAF